MLHRQQDLARVPSRIEVLVRLGGLLEREASLHRRADRARFNERPDVLGDLGVNARGWLPNALE